MTTPTPRGTASRWTPAGRGAIAVIRVSAHADDVLKTSFLPVNGRPWSKQPLSRPIYGRWGSDASEEVVVCRLSDSEFEIQCHGGDAAVRRILNDLAELGFSIVDADVSAAQFDLLEHELQTALMHALTWRTADLLNEQASGLLRTTFERFVAFPQTDDHRRAVRAMVESLIAWSNFGLYLSRPWSVVLTGRPNVGKSSLINALLGYRRAIVADQPGTTRDVVASLTAFDGWPVELADTAGLRTARESLEASGIELARNKLASADVRMLLIDIGEPPQSEDWELLAEWPDALVVAHKSDLPDQWGDRVPSGVVRVSSRTGAGLDELIGALVRRIVPQEPRSGTPLPVSARQVLCLKELFSALDGNDDRRYQIAARKLVQGEPGASATGAAGGVGSAHLLLQ